MKYISIIILFVFILILIVCDPVKETFSILEGVRGRGGGGRGGGGRGGGVAEAVVEEEVVEEEEGDISIEEEEDGMVVTGVIAIDLLHQL